MSLIKSNLVCLHGRYCLTLIDKLFSCSSRYQGIEYQHIPSLQQAQATDSMIVGIDIVGHPYGKFASSQDSGRSLASSDEECGDERWRVSDVEKRINICMLIRRQSIQPWNAGFSNYHQIFYLTASSWKFIHATVLRYVCNIIKKCDPHQN